MSNQIFSVKKSNQKKQGTGSDAWLLEYQSSKYIALPITACQEILENPDVLYAPGIAKFAHGLISWRNQWLPLIDLSSLLIDSKKTDMTRYCLIVAYHATDGSIEFIGLSLPYMPHTISITDDAICGLPDGELWTRIAPSCIQYNNTRVPIVHSSKLFAFQ